MTGPMTTFINGSYQDTLPLMTELRVCSIGIKTGASEESPNETLDAIYPVVRAAVIGEIQSITCDLTEAMAWLLPQRATPGKISPTQANTPADGLLGEDSAPAVSNVPIEIRRYIDRSCRLYGWIVRLRETAAQNAG